MSLDFLGTGLFRMLAGEYGDLMFDRGLLSMAEIEVAVGLEPKVAARHRDLGRRLLQDAKPALARQVLMRALELNPDDAAARLGLTCTLDAMGMTQTAIEELIELLERQPAYGPAIAAMNYCSEKLGDTLLTHENQFESEEVASIG